MWVLYLPHNLLPTMILKIIALSKIIHTPVPNLKCRRIMTMLCLSVFPKGNEDENEDYMYIVDITRLQRLYGGDGFQ